MKRLETDVLDQQLGCTKAPHRNSPGQLSSHDQRALYKRQLVSPLLKPIHAEAFNSRRIPCKTGSVYPLGCSSPLNTNSHAALNAIDASKSFAMGV